MSQPPYRALRVVLGFLSLLLAIGGLLMIFGSKALIMRVFMHLPRNLYLASSDAEGDGWDCADGQRDAVSGLARPRAQRGDYRHGQCGFLRTGNHATRVSVHVGRGKALSGVSDLGTVLRAISLGWAPLLFAAAGGGSCRGRSMRIGPSLHIGSGQAHRAVVRCTDWAAIAFPSHPLSSPWVASSFIEGAEI
jgi:hypothetical protein